MRLHSAAVLALAVAAIGCDSSATSPSDPPFSDVVGDGPVTAVVDVAEASAGANVEVSFASTDAAAFWFNPCERQVQRESGGEWTTLPSELRLCNDMAYILEANGQRVEEVDVPTFAEPGRYRFVFTMRRAATTEVANQAVSTAFEVR